MRALGRALLGAVGALLLAGPALAQRPGRPEGRSPGGPGATAGDTPRDEVLRMAEAYLLSNMQDALGLTDDQFVKLLPIVKRLQSDRKAFAQRRHQTIAEMRRTLQAGGATEASVNDLMKQLRAAEAEEPEIIRKDYDALDRLLAPLQQAKFRVLEAEVMRKIRDLSEEVRARRGARLRPGLDGGRRRDDPDADSPR